MAAPINPQAYSHYIPYSNGPVQYEYHAPQRPQTQQVFVNGIVEAQNYPVAPGNTIILMDANEPVFYLKSQNQLRVFDYTERVQEPANTTEYVTKAEFEELKKMLDDLTKG